MFYLRLGHSSNPSKVWISTFENRSGNYLFQKFDRRRSAPPTNEARLKSCCLAHLPFIPDLRIVGTASHHWKFKKKTQCSHSAIQETPTEASGFNRHLFNRHFEHCIENRFELAAENPFPCKQLRILIRKPIDFVRSLARAQRES